MKREPHMWPCTPRALAMSESQSGGVSIYIMSAARKPPAAGKGQSVAPVSNFIRTVSARR